MAMHARISTIEGDPGRIDQAIDVVREKAIPALRGLPGFVAVNFLAERSTGKLVAVAFYADRSALEASAEAAGSLRHEVAGAMGGRVVGVESYELVAQSW
jgi:hypothetical protein